MQFFNLNESGEKNDDEGGGDEERFLRHPGTIQHVRQAETERAAQPAVGEHGLVPEVDPARARRVVHRSQQVDAQHAAHQAQRQSPQHEVRVPHVRVVDHRHAQEHQDHGVTRWAVNLIRN